MDSENIGDQLRGNLYSTAKGVHTYDKRIQGYNRLENKDTTCYLFHSKNTHAQIETVSAFDLERSNDTQPLLRGYQAYPYSGNACARTVVIHDAAASGY